MKNFKISEFACKCGCQEARMQPCLLNSIDHARELAGVPFVITSGYRCQKHNKAIGGVETSAHTRGYAADIAVNLQSRDIILKACEKYFKRIGVASGFIHVDCDPDKPSPARWKYDK